MTEPYAAHIALRSEATVAPQALTSLAELKQLELAILNPLGDLACVVPLDPRVREELLALMATAIVTAYLDQVDRGIANEQLSVLHKGHRRTPKP